MEEKDFSRDREGVERIRQLRRKVEELYQSQVPERAEWADWLFAHHVFVVAENARELSKRYGVDNDLAEAAAMLHDIADAVMSRFADEHEGESMRIAREMLEKSGYSEEAKKIIVDDAIAYHACKNGEIPQTMEGKIMATADAMAHLQTEFYKFAKEMREKQGTAEEVKQWALPKIEHDYHEKIFFDEIREELKEDYKRAEALFQ